MVTKILQEQNLYWLTNCKRGVIQLGADTLVSQATIRHKLTQVNPKKG